MIFKFVKKTHTLWLFFILSKASILLLTCQDKIKHYLPSDYQKKKKNRKQGSKVAMFTLRHTLYTKIFTLSEKFYFLYFH